MQVDDPANNRKAIRSMLEVVMLNPFFAEIAFRKLDQQILAEVSELVVREM